VEGVVLDVSLCMCIVVNYVDTKGDTYFPLRTQSNNGLPLLVQRCDGTYCRAGLFGSIGINDAKSSP
jgi:hypothetical protein